MKLVMNNCHTSIEDCHWTKKELELIFSPNQVIVFKSAIKKGLLSSSAASFFHRYILHAYHAVWIGFC